MGFWMRFLSPVQLMETLLQLVWSMLWRAAAPRGCSCICQFWLSATFSSEQYQQPYWMANHLCRRQSWGLFCDGFEQMTHLPCLLCRTGVGKYHYPTRRPISRRIQAAGCNSSHQMIWAALPRVRLYHACINACRRQIFWGNWLLGFWWQHQEQCISLLYCCEISLLQKETWHMCDILITLWKVGTCTTLWHCNFTEFRGKTTRRWCCIVLLAL